MSSNQYGNNSQGWNEYGEYGQPGNYGTYGQQGQSQQQGYGQQQPAYELHNQSQYGQYDQSQYGQGQYGQGQQGYDPYAGYQQPGYPMTAPKSKMAAGILGILLGGLGIHNFYLGHTGKALAQLLITVLSFGFLAVVSSIWGLIEGVLIMTSSPGTKWSFDAQGNPLT